jgi:hypothetical protein
MGRRCIPFNGPLHDNSDLLEAKSKAGQEEVLLLPVLYADIRYRICIPPKMCKLRANDLDLR